MRRANPKKYLELIQVFHLSFKNFVLLVSKDERVVKNFYQLILEELFFWSEWFGVDSKGKVTKYRTVLEDVAVHVQMPKKILFFTKEKPKKTDDSQNRSSSSQAQNIPKQSIAESQNKPKESVPRREEKTPGQTGKTPSGNAAIREISKVVLVISIDLFRWSTSNNRW